ncbi:uncharacterized protein [Typha angustifolia]|uniref:uncharacterized protein isoform X1 n=2 Tax=Typha angustifolia TaxID=59011 RepID=UPI003C2DE48B
MEIIPLTSQAAPCFRREVSNLKVQSANGLSFRSAFHFNSHSRAQKKCLVSSALPETAASVLVASIAVGAAVTVLARKTEASQKDIRQSSLKVCEDCGGSGICAECNGEGFIPKKMSEENAEKARLAAKNMATRFTAGLPKKWSYCSKCSSARSCSICGGSGRISW